MTTRSFLLSFDTGRFSLRPFDDATRTWFGADSVQTQGASNEAVAVDAIGSSINVRVDRKDAPEAMRTAALLVRRKLEAAFPGETFDVFADTAIE